MAANVFNNICEQQIRPSLVKPTGLVCGLGGATLPVIGETEVHVTGAGPLRVLVTKNLPHELIMGSDALEAGHGVVDYNTNTMEWYGQEFPLTPYTDYVPKIETLDMCTGNGAMDKTLQEYKDVFAQSKTDLGYCDIIPFTIDTGDAPPVRKRPYKTPLHKRQEIERQIDIMLETGVIEPSRSPWASPITMAPKKDHTWRFCADYRALNAVTRKDHYPLPLIQDIFDQLEGAKIFSTLDLQTGFWQIPVAEKDREKTSFVCHRGSFQFVRMPFGVQGAPALFQRVMDYVLRDLIGRCCFVYIDDIVIYSRTPEEHTRHMAEVLEKLRQAGLKVKPSKCKFSQKQLLLLGYIVSGEGIRSDPEKTAAIADMQPPENAKEVRRFLGMCGYYQQTIPDYAALATPLRALTRKRSVWRWSTEHERCFRQLQQELMSGRVLAYPRTDRPYILHTDACGYAVGGVLVQKDDDGLERVIQYVSHQLQESQRKWATIEKEAYAIVYCLTKLRPYLWGADFVIMTDHKPLRSFFKCEVADTRVQRWAVLIAEYGAPIQYRAGRYNLRADMLSRLRPVYVDVVDTDDYIEPPTGTIT